MLQVKVFVTRPLGTDCRRLIYLAGEIASRFPGNVEVVIDENTASEVDAEQPRPYIQIDDYIIGKNVEPAKLEQIITGKLKNCPEKGG